MKSTYEQRRAHSYDRHSTGSTGRTDALYVLTNASMADSTLAIRYYCALNETSNFFEDNNIEISKGKPLFGP